VKKKTAPKLVACPWIDIATREISAILAYRKPWKNYQPNTRLRLAKKLVTEVLLDYRPDLFKGCNTFYFFTSVKRTPGDSTFHHADSEPEACSAVTPNIEDAVKAFRLANPEAELRFVSTVPLYPKQKVPVEKRIHNDLCAAYPGLTQKASDKLLFLAQKIVTEVVEIFCQPEKPLGKFTFTYMDYTGKTSVKTLTSATLESAIKTFKKMVPHPIQRITVPA
jgi:hypothetical protein